MMNASPDTMYLLAIILVLVIPQLYLLPVASRRSFLTYLVLSLLWIVLMILAAMLRS